VNIPALIVCGISVRQDADGRYCINDLHRASGGEKRHRPNYWLENQQTKDLIAELRNQLILPEDGNPVSDEIKYLEPVRTVRSLTEGQGTFVVKELVYAYAMWISAPFHLKVIRAYDAMVTQPKPAFDPSSLTREDILLMALDSERERKRLEAELEAAQPAIQFHEEVSQSHGELTIREVWQVLLNGERGGERRLRDWLRINGWLTPAKGEVSAYALQRGFMRVRPILGGDGRLWPTPVVTGLGLTTLRHLYRTGELFTGGIERTRLLLSEGVQ
jgi:phage antirepressor YoqD-like protein